MINEKKVPDEIAINLCELIGRSSEDMHSWIERLITDTPFGNCSRIYLGSYYCDHYFLQTSVSRYTDVICFAREREIKITLVIPPLFETNLEKGISLAEKLISEGRDLIDEVTINDWGMLQYFSKVSNVKINMGRLLQKDNRDPRYIDFFNETHTHRCFSGFYKQMLSTNDPKTGLIDIQKSVDGAVAWDQEQYLFSNDIHYIPQKIKFDKRIIVGHYATLFLAEYRQANIYYGANYIKIK